MVVLGFLLIVRLMAGSCAVGAYVVWEAMRTGEDEEEDEEDVVFCDRH